MSWKTFVRDYLTFSKKDRTALYFISGLLLIIYLLPHLSAKPGTSVPITEDTTLARAFDTLQQLPSPNRELAQEEDHAFKYPYEPSQPAGYAAGELFVFDPNTLPTEGWQRLGLNHKTIRTINNYRNKGGRFYKPEDLKKIWGLPAGFYDRVASYIQITAHRNTMAPSPTSAPVNNRTERKMAVVNVNEADTAALIALPGIGSKLANRIIAFRNKLGGFYAVEQLKETYGLPDSTYQLLRPYLTVNSQAVKKLNLNTITKEELKAHPYIKWNLANAIVEYRHQHGPFKDLQELKNIMLMDEATFQKIAPYLTL